MKRSDYREYQRVSIDEHRVEQWCDRFVLSAGLDEMLSKELQKLNDSGMAFKVIADRVKYLALPDVLLGASMAAFVEEYAAAHSHRRNGGKHGT